MKVRQKQKLKCEYCNNHTVNAGEDAVKWVCSSCVQKSMHGEIDINFKEENQEESN